MSVSVWVLIVYMSSGYGGGPVVIDDIASKKDCEWLATQIDVWRPKPGNFRCFRVNKVITQPGKPN